MGTPSIETIGGVRGLLEIASSEILHRLLRSRYARFEIPKPRGLGTRKICAPPLPLRAIQRTILRKILDEVPVHPAAHGFVRGRSVITNARPHCFSAVVLNYDLKDFFPTVSYRRVVGLFASLGYPAGDGRPASDDNSESVAATLAALCCYEHRLPQGAPTSPALANLTCRRLDRRLVGLARQFGGMYTRYADDLTFSFRHGVPDTTRFAVKVLQYCGDEGFVVNEKKSKVSRRRDRQEVTGVLVNGPPRTPREVRRRLRAALHNCEQGRGDLNELAGLAGYVNMVRPLEGKRLLRVVRKLVRASGPGDGGS
jgi:hypothetical protein